MSLNNAKISDPFEDFNSGNFDDEVKIVIRVDRVRGKKMITTISGFSSTTYEKKDINKMSKDLKVFCACASSVGRIPIDNDEKQPYYFTLHGDHAKTAKSYLIGKNIANENDIEFHGIASI